MTSNILCRFLMKEDFQLGFSGLNLVWISKIRYLWKDNFNTTAKNTLNSPNILVWKFGGKPQFPHTFGKLSGNCAFPKNFHTWKLVDITVLFAVYLIGNHQNVFRGVCWEHGILLKLNYIANILIKIFDNNFNFENVTGQIVLIVVLMVNWFLDN